MASPACGRRKSSITAPEAPPPDGPLVERIDHVVLTVASVAVTVAFYARTLGLTGREDAGRPTALHFGTAKINLHQVDRTFEPKAVRPTPGSADLCLVTTRPIETVVARIHAAGVAIEVGPVQRTGALGAMTSVYFRDPDGNLVEVSRYA